MIHEIISEAVQRGIYLFLKEGKLAYKVVGGELPADFRSILEMQKSSIVEFLKLQSNEMDENRIHLRPKDGSPVNIPLSYAQQRLWLLDQLDGGSTHYNLPIVLKLIGDLNQDALSRAFKSIINRHESLRTRFQIDENGQPTQVVQSAKSFCLPLVDLSFLECAAQQLKISELMSGEYHRVFDLGCDLMVQCTLVKVNSAEHVVLLTLHHIASDGWSMPILIREFSELYTAYCSGKASSLEPLPIQYSDYAYWQRNYLQGDLLEQKLMYWVNQLKELPAVHGLPLDHVRPLTQTFSGQTHFSVIDRATGDALKNLCQSQGATIFMGLQSAFSVLLSRQSNEVDIVIGIPIANRQQAEVAGLIGFFVNTLVLRTDLSGDPCFIELLKQSKRVLLDAYEYQQVPFEKVVERLQPERSLSHNPLFQVMLVLQNNEVGELELPGLTLKVVEESGLGFSKYDLTLNVLETEVGFRLSWEYNSDLFECATISRIAAHFSCLIKSLIRCPDQSVFDVQMMSDEECNELFGIARNGDGCGAILKPRFLHSRILEQIAINGHRTAVTTKSKVLTYQELGGFSDQLYLQLQVGGARVNELVAIVMEKGWEQIVAVLAILRSGAAYLPVDANLPLERITMLLELGEVSQVITTPSLAKKYFLDSRLSVIVVDKDYRFSSHESVNDRWFPPALSVDDLAYVIFTSGSTGSPKGVMIDHKGASNTVDDICTRFELTSSDSVLALSNLNFDLSVFDIFGLLAVGGKVVIPTEEEIKDPSAWVDYLETERITIWNTVPAFMQLLVKHCIGKMNSYPLRLILMSGDWIPKDLPPQIMKVFPAARQISLGGATEASIWSISYPIDNVVDRQLIPYGKALTNQHVFVLQKNLSPAPYGVIGDIYIGGVGVSLGYWKEYPKTQSSFIVNPVTGERLYKTGDLGRVLSSGNIEFMGRIDHQVKIRGFRIELGEIESCLINHSDVKGVTVMSKTYTSTDGEESKRLVAYVIPTEDRENKAIYDDSEYIKMLQYHVRKNLPDYMLPSIFVVLDNFPLTQNGKLDRKALPDPDLTPLQNIYVPPQTEAERRLCEVWQEVLGLDRVGTSDNFFQLGGVSLDVMRVIARASRDSFKISAKDIYTNQTISDLAKIYSGGEMKSMDLSLEALAVHSSVVSKFFENDRGGAYDTDLWAANIKKLPVIVQQEVTTYLHRSLPLCIVRSYPYLDAWYYSNFIRIFSSTNRDGFTALEYLDDRECVRHLGDQKYLCFDDLKYSDSITDEVIRQVSNGFYVTIELDEFYLSIKSNFRRSHFVHCSLIYGFDLDRSIFFAVGFDHEHMFSNIELDFSEFDMSYESAKVLYMEGAPWAQWGAIRLFKPFHAESAYPFDARRFVQELGDYLFSREDLPRVYNFNYKNVEFTFGHSVYDKVIEKLTLSLSKELYIDYNAIHLLSQHQSGLYERLVFLDKLECKNFGLKEKLEPLKKIHHVFDGARIRLYAATLDPRNLHLVLKDTISAVEVAKKGVSDVLTPIYCDLARHYYGQ